MSTDPAKADQLVAQATLLSNGDPVATQQLLVDAIIRHATVHARNPAARDQQLRAAAQGLVAAMHDQEEVTQV